VENDRSIRSMLFSCFVYSVAYVMLGVVFFFLTVIILDSTYAYPINPYEIDSTAGIGYLYISLAISFFGLSPLTLLGVAFYNAYFQRKRQKEKRKNESLGS
jgi:hypothetical protein